MYIGLIGPGAVGCFYGYHLQQAGAKIILVSPRHATAIQNHGIQINSIWKNALFIPDYVVKKPKDLPYPIDYLLICSKVFPSENPHLSIKPALSDNTHIVLIQNGLNIELAYHTHYPSHPLISALAFICVHRQSPTEITHVDYGNLMIGPYPDNSHSHTDPLIALLKRTPIPTHYSPSIVMERWKKLQWNAAFGPLSVILGHKTTKQLLTHATSYQLLCTIMDEIHGLAASQGYALSDKQDFLDKTHTMTPYKTSMLLDYEAKKPMEHDAILGTACHLANTCHYPAPLLNACYTLLKQLSP